MEHEAIHGLMHQEFIMYLQPIVEIGSGKIMGAEALVRWQNPGRGLMQPGDFLDVIKRKQLTGKMNMDIFRQGCRFLREEADKGKKLDLLFNFTVENVGDEQFAEELNTVAEQYGIDRDRIVIQLNQIVEMSRSDSFMTQSANCADMVFISVWPGWNWIVFFLISLTAVWTALS